MSSAVERGKRLVEIHYASKNGSSARWLCDTLIRYERSVCDEGGRAEIDDYANTLWAIEKLPLPLAPFIEKPSA